MEERITYEIKELFKSTQITSAVHQKNAVLLKKLYENSPKELFFLSLTKVINSILKIEKGNKFIEKVIDFLALFCSILKSRQVESAEETLEYIEHPLVLEILEYLLETSQLNRDIIRFRSCEVINKILDHLVGSEVSSNLCEKIEEALLLRLQDPKNIIRQQGVIALHRLQDPGNPEDAVIPQFINLMNSDSFAKVRLLCIENIAARRDVINYIVLRTRDVDVNVRIAAFKRLSNFAEYLKISDKRHILHAGFLDNSDKVRNFVSTTLLMNWLQHYENNILVLMKSIRLDADEKDIEKTENLYEYILTAFLKTKSLTELSQVLSINEEKLIPIENINWEIAAYWRIYVQFLSKNYEFEAELEKVVPELVYFCNYVKKFYIQAHKEVTAVEFLEQQFIIKQFFLIIKAYDFSDVSNRRCLNSLVCNILEKAVLMSDVIEIIISTLEYSIPKIDHRSQFITEIISEIMYPMNSEESQKLELEREFQLSQIRVKLNCLLEKQSEAVKAENYIEADRLKREIVETNNILNNLKNTPAAPQQIQKRTDIPTIVKYLDIAAGLLLSPKVTELTPSLKALKDDVIQELLIHDNDTVRAKALKCYSLCCIVDKTCAWTGIHIFSTPIFAYQNGEECDTQTLLTCIAAVVDLLRIYGSQLMAAPPVEALSESMEEAHERVFAGGTSLTDLIQGLVDLMNDEQYEIQEKAAFGLCQLVLSDRIHSPSLISRLVLKWCSPATENSETEKLTQIIGYTLERVPSMTDNCNQLEEAVLMTIKALAHAPRFSPLADVNIENIAKFLISLCKTSPQGVQIHANLARTICFEMADKPKNRLNLILSKTLLMLDVPNDKMIIQELLTVCDLIRDDVNDRIILNNIVKFISSLSSKNVDKITVIQEENEE